jgi:hypothetical protein
VPVTARMLLEQGGPDWALGYSPGYSPGYSASRENDRLREKFTEKVPNPCRPGMVLYARAYVHAHRCMTMHICSDQQRGAGAGA